MWKIQLLAIAFGLLFLIGCQSSETLTPTPFPPTPDNAALGISSSSITPVPAVLSDVMANPEFYEGAHVQVTGQYFRSPLQVCGIDPHPSPAGWELVTGDTRIPAGGFNDQLRQLMPDGITMTVIGRLTYWQGPVGCSKQAVPTEFWYLDVVKLVDPAQLARVTLTPGSASDGLIFEGDIGDELFTPIAVEDEIPPQEDEFLPTSPPIAPPTNTVQPTRVVPIETLGAGFTPVATGDIAVSTPTASRESDATGTAVATTSGTVVSAGTEQSATPGISTVTNTPPPGASLTPTSVSGATPIATAVNSSVIEKDGDLEIAEFKMEELRGPEIHEWTMPLDADEEIIVSVIGEPSMDLAIKIFNENQTELENQDDYSAGQAETVTFNSLNDNNYKVQISEKNGASGGYLLVIGSEDFLLSYPLGMLSYGGSDGATISWDELHFWFFRGEEDDSIDLAISCDTNSDLLLRLLDSDGDDIDGLFLEEQLENIVLPQTDWYVIEIEHWDPDEDTCTYQMIITK